MPLFTASDRRQAVDFARLAYTNPFLPERFELEKKVLGKNYQASGAVWNVQRTADADYKSVKHLSVVAADLVHRARQRSGEREGLDPVEQGVYIDIALYHLYDKYRDQISATVDSTGGGAKTGAVAYWNDFLNDFNVLFTVRGRNLEIGFDAPHALAVFFQIRRAFFHIFYFIVGSSTGAAQLRAAVWESIFTHDLRRYQQHLYRHMADMTTLITGPTGTGKELVARAIGCSRYIPFQPVQRSFAGNFANSASAVNLSALSPTLIESELFGHRRGAFTGALGDRIGWLEACPEHGSVFLDEIGELDLALQVKLLRILQNRTFQRLGDTEERVFSGKVLAATNRDLAVDMRNGSFREDLYYRLCSDRIVTPSLREQLNDCPDDLRHLLAFIARRISPQDADALAQQVGDWIDAHLGADYAWPGNIRELEQCFRSVIIHAEYLPAAVPVRATNDWKTTASAMEQGRLKADTVLQHYCQLVYERCGSFEKAAELLGLDRRTVKRKIEELKSR